MLHLNLELLQISTWICVALVNKVQTTEGDKWKKEIEISNQITWFFSSLLRDAKCESLLAGTREFSYH